MNHTTLNTQGSSGGTVYKLLHTVSQKMMYTGGFTSCCGPGLGVTTTSLV